MRMHPAFKLETQKKTLKFLSFQGQNNLLFLHVCVIDGSTVLWFSKSEYLSRYPFTYYTAESLWRNLLKMWRLWFCRGWCHWLPGVRCVSSAFHCQLKQTQNLSGVNSSCLPPDITPNSFGICFRFRERDTFDELLVRALFSNLWITLR